MLILHTSPFCPLFNNPNNSNKVEGVVDSQDEKVKNEEKKEMSNESLATNSLRTTLATSFAEVTELERKRLELEEKKLKEQNENELKRLNLEEKRLKFERDLATRKLMVEEKESERQKRQDKLEKLTLSAQVRVVLEQKLLDATKRM